MNTMPASTLPRDTSPSLRDPLRLLRWRQFVLGLLLLWPLMHYSQFQPWLLFDAQSLQALGHFLASSWPPAHDAEFLQMLWQATWQTIAIATCGVTLALLIAIPSSLAISDSLSRSLQADGKMHWYARLLRQVLRALLVLLRSVPELVWALLLVRLVGLGPTAGVLAIALTYSGMLGKIYAEILDASAPHASKTLLQHGASRLQTLLYAALPQALPELLSYTVYRWECALRGSVVLGFVGAGGLGQRMDESLKMMAGNEVASMLVIFMLLVAAADAISAYLRRHFAA